MGAELACTEHALGRNGWWQFLGWQQECGATKCFFTSWIRAHFQVGILSQDCYVTLVDSSLSFYLCLCLMTTISFEYIFNEICMYRLVRYSTKQKSRQIIWYPTLSIVIQRFLEEILWNRRSNEPKGLNLGFASIDFWELYEWRKISPISWDLSYSSRLSQLYSCLWDSGAWAIPFCLQVFSHKVAHYRFQHFNLKTLKTWGVLSDEYRLSSSVFSVKWSTYKARNGEKLGFSVFCFKSDCP